MNKSVVLAGGSGQVGNILARALLADGHMVTVLSRNPAVAGQVPWRVVGWDGTNPGAWVAELDGADVVINLAGRSVNCRYTPANREAIISSRVRSVEAIGQAIQRVSRPPRLWLQASTATIYAHRYDAPNDEHTGIIGGDEPGAADTWRFSIDVAKQWEAAVDAFALPMTRTVKMRTAMVMSPDKGGVFDTLLALVRLGLGGTNGNGRQYVSWIHEHDFVQAIYHLIAMDTFSGVVNIASPNPVPNREFMRELRAAWGMPIGLPATEWMLEIGARALQTETELILKSRRVIPARLLESDFSFGYPTWADAAKELCQRSRTGT